MATKGRGRIEAPDDHLAGLDRLALIHELQVHQSELEAQNEALRRSQLEIEAERERYQRLFAGAPVAYLAIDRGSTIVEANRAARAMLGRELPGARLSSFVARSDVRVYTLYLRDVFASYGTRAVDLTLISADGEKIPACLETSASVAGTANVAIIDLRDRQAVERSRRALAASESRFQDTVESLPVGFAVLDRHWRFEAWNTALVEMTGVPADEVVGEDLFDVFPQVADHPGFALCEQVMDSGKPGSITSECTLRDGRALFYQLHVYPDDVGLSLICIDVTERRRAEIAAKRERQRWRAILDNASDAILTIDERGIIESCNPMATTMFESPMSELLGTSVGALLPESPGTGDIIAFLHSGDEQLSGPGRELEASRPGGELFPIQLRAVSIQVGGDRSLCCFIRDLTASKKVEEERRRAQRLEAVGTLASGVAHDVNNLLMGVGSCATVALAHLDDESPARLYIEAIGQSAKSGASISKQLLAFTRKSALISTVFRLDQLVADSEPMLRRLIGADIAMRVELGAGDARVRADVGQIEQVLLNLAVNARDAMDEGGTLTIETCQDGELVVLRVSDTGVGMSPEVRERVFDPFFTTKGPSEGTGLGLSTVYGIVKQAGGTISVDSRPDRGSCFEVRLPRAREPITEELEVVDDRPAVGRQAVTVLLCEDDQLVRMALRQLLETAGMHVLEAAGAGEAIGLSAEYGEHIDLLLSDVVLPELTGSQVADAIRQQRPDIAVLLMSAHAAEWLERRGRIRAGTPTMQKPFDDVELLARIDELLTSARVSEP